MENNEELKEKKKDSVKKKVLIGIGITAGTLIVGGLVALAMKRSYENGYSLGYLNGYKLGNSEGSSKGFNKGFGVGYSSAIESGKISIKNMVELMDTSYERGKTSIGSELTYSRDKVYDEGIRKGVEISESSNRIKEIMKSKVSVNDIDIPA